ncbi:hypothetical protein OG225_42110 (plasmid) [Nocardia sp. NBC_01377]|uniref:hypothetical protein n=1 Tax=Nocardia sp. NBC_01377 TaxID=2903595 RepID=UPI00324375E6
MRAAGIARRSLAGGGVRSGNGTPWATAVTRSPESISIPPLGGAGIDWEESSRLLEVVAFCGGAADCHAA